MGPLMPNDVYGRVAAHVPNRQQKLSACTFCRSFKHCDQRFTCALTAPGALKPLLYLGRMSPPQMASSSSHAVVTFSFNVVALPPLAEAHLHAL